MKIIHRISINSSPQVQRELATLGIAAPLAGFFAFDAEEASSLWPALSRWIDARRAVDIARTEFSKEEIDEASWLALQPEWHCGYPQPDEGSFGYLAATYDLTEWCDMCGVGKKQRAPFQMKAEPRWGKHDVLQMNWVFDEFFVRPEAYAAVFERHGVGKRSVIDGRGRELQSVVQLVVTEEAPIDPSQFTPERCAKCGRTKYVLSLRGHFAPLLDSPSSPAVRTREWFGSGANANKPILVSRPIARDMRHRKLRGVSFRPVSERQMGITI